MAVKYTEENGQYTIDCTAALWSTDEIHNCYQDRSHTYGMIGFLCDVDFIIETQTHILLVEYKNSAIPGAAHPERFNPSSENKLENVARKFYDSSHWLYLMGKDKPKMLVYILEYPAGNSTSRLLIRNMLQQRLPFALQSKITGAGRKLIDEVKVLNISEWNSDAELGRYPLRPVGIADT
ncbi:MAG: hypothetical protein HFG66_04480 [Hungatella sp.]|nr:hypothetical protein [Hungatella sp.]